MLEIKGVPRLPLPLLLLQESGLRAKKTDSLELRWRRDFASRKMLDRLKANAADCKLRLMPKMPKTRLNLVESS